MKFGKHRIVFGACHHEKVVWGSDSWTSRVKKQRWDIPSLELHGYVVIEWDSRVHTMDQIRNEIFAEVRFDLEQRAKRLAGIRA